jgi:opacity protein-like surface antigen
VITCLRFKQAKCLSHKYDWLILLFFLLLIGQQDYSQSKFSDNLKLSGSYHLGYSLPEYSFISYLTNDYVQSFEINLLKETSGKNPWESLYNYPEYGLSFFYTTLGNSQVLGNAYALNYFFKLKFIDRKRFDFYNRVGIGLGYLTKRYDINSNYMNLAIGSHFNVHFVFKLGIQYNLTDRLSSNIGLSFDHFSNANTRDPNRGLNAFTGELGIEYLLSKKLEKLNPSFDTHSKENDITTFFSVGTKQPRSFEAKHYQTASLSLSLNRSVFRAVHLGVGVDVFYDSYAKTFIEKSGNNFRTQDSFQTGVSMSQQFIYNRFRIIIQEGIYVGLPNKVIPKLMYNRAAVQYDISDKILVRLAMKSHLHILDFPELGIGIKM